MTDTPAAAISQLERTEFHAVLTATVRISDLGSGQTMTLQCVNGPRLKVRASANVLRQRVPLRDTFQATLQLRSDLSGRLKPSVRLMQLTKNDMGPQDPEPMRWSAAGLASVHDQTLVVFPPDARTSPVQICFQAFPGSSLNPDPGSSLWAQGVIRRGVLEATSVRRVEPLVRPRRWADWRRWF